MLLHDSNKVLNGFCVTIPDSGFCFCFHMNVAEAYLYVRLLHKSIANIVFNWIFI